jgi:diguanylate cyclase (GGDEF)-like protein
LKPRGLPPEPFDGFEHAPVDFMTSPWDPGTLATKVSTFVTVARLKQEALLSEQAMEVMALELRSTHERLASKERELSTVTALDKLTGLPNRLRMAETLHSEWLRMTREGKSLAMLFIDVDHLRLFQEHYGQGAEERCLRRIAMALDGAFRRPGDILGRFGAEKFGAILPDTDIAGTKHIAEAACAAVRGLDIEHAASPVSNVVTVSVGAGSVRPGPGCTAADLIQAADKALYKAKLAGRDKVAYSDCEPEACVST